MPLGWYLARLRAMSAEEVVWRAASGVGRRLRPERTDGTAAVNWKNEEWRQTLWALAKTAQDELIAAAARIAAGELDLWGRAVIVDPHRPAWHIDPLNGAPAPARRRWHTDPKPLWELHRQQHLFPLAAGAALAGQDEWAEVTLAQILNWIERNPRAERGPGWTSGYETAHRLVAWAFALPLVVHDATPAQLARISHSFGRQARFVADRPSRYSSANNHRLAELAGLLAASLLGFGEERWEQLWAELEEETIQQTFGDGGSREQAAGYFLYVLEILWTAGLLAHGARRPLGRIRSRLEAMLGWLEAVAGMDGEPPPVGDDAEDRMLRPDYFEPRRAEAIAGRVRALLEGKPSLTRSSGSVTSSVSSVLLPESGYAVLRSVVDGSPVRIVFDVGDLGLGRLAAHGHADALSVLLDIGDRTVLRDSGTGSYAPEETREGFRATAAHNTVVVDGESQARSLGPHLWGRRFTTRVEAAALTPEVDYIRASHDGYLDAQAGAVHTRSVTFLKPDLLVVIDRVKARLDCIAELMWQLAPHATPESIFEGHAGLRVAASPEAAAGFGEGRFSTRYGSQEEAPRHVWASRGEEVVFATAVGFARTAPNLRLSRTGDAAVVELLAPRRVRVTETWRDSAPSVAT
jgi:hypothetical protein